MTTDKDWIEWKWTPEKPYPETLETTVRVLYKGGYEGMAEVGFLHDEDYEFSNWYDHEDEDTVAFYRVIP